MSEETKRFLLDSLRKSFAEFMQEVVKIPGSPMHKQQAFFRFEEAHMWLQNAIVSYVEPKPKAPEVSPEAPAANDSAPVAPAGIETQPQE